MIGNFTVKSDSTVRVKHEAKVTKSDSRRWHKTLTTQYACARASIFRHSPQV